MNGLFFGKFAPLTTGHIYAITIAAGQVDELHLVLCWDEKFQHKLSDAMQKSLSLSNRMLTLQNTFKHLSNVKITYVDESNIDSYPEGSADFTDLVLQKTAGIEFDKVFSSEKEYNEYFSTHWPDAEHVLIDPERNTVNISATRVRSNPYLYWNYIAPEARQYFVKKVCVIGVESTGKSTLVKNLANRFGTGFVEEVGRTICEEQYGFSEEFMKQEHYEYIAMEHKCKEQRMLKGANKVLFSDTNNLITLFSMQCQYKDSPMVQAMARAEEYDLVIFLDIDVPWVYDPLRQNNEPILREGTNKTLKQMCYEYKVKYIEVKGNYNERYNTSVELVNKLLTGHL